MQVAQHDGSPLFSTSVSRTRPRGSSPRPTPSLSRHGCTLFRCSVVASGSATWCGCAGRTSTVPAAVYESLTSRPRSGGTWFARTARAPRSFEPSISTMGSWKTSGSDKNVYEGRRDPRPATAKWTATAADPRLRLAFPAPSPLGGRRRRRQGELRPRFRGGVGQGHEPPLRPRLTEDLPNITTRHDDGEPGEVAGLLDDSRLLLSVDHSGAMEFGASSPRRPSPAKRSECS